MNDKFMRARSTFEELIAQRMEQYAVQGTQANEAYAAQTHAAPSTPAETYAAPPTRADTYSAPGWDAAPSASGASAAVEPAPYAPSAAATSSAAAYTAPTPDLGPVPQEDEKRRLFERARAEVEAYQRAYHPEPEPESEPAPDARGAPSSHSAAESLAGLHLS